MKYVILKENSSNFDMIYQGSLNVCKKIYEKIARSRYWNIAIFPVNDANYSDPVIGWSIELPKY